MSTATPPELLTAMAPGSPSALTPVVPEDAPFAPDQRQWLNGLLAGLTVLARAAQDRGAGPGGADAAAPAVPLTILYGSQSGNGEALSKDLRKHAKAAGFAPDVKELNDIDLADLPGVGRAVVVCSTFGEGDPPDNAAKFFDRVLADDAPSLEGLAFSVCGLGDSSYTHFNKSGRDLDARLAELGATRVADFVACDVAYEDDYAEWKSAVFASEEFASAAGGAAPAAEAGDAEAVEKYTKNEPFFATVLDVHNLSTPASAKEVNHVELSLAGSGLEYKVGDALGLWPGNCVDLVQQTLDAAGFTGRETVLLKTGPTSLRAALLDRLDLCTVTAKTYAALGLSTPVELPAGLHVVDLLETESPPDLTPQSFVDALRPLQPRLYSIASSPEAHPGEVHLTVGAVRYTTHGKPRKGVASTFLADRCSFGARVGVYVQRSAHFHIPSDDVPLIMIGPGTGIAPFRAFLEERAVRFDASPSRNWLFFGDQHEASDFLYREEIGVWQASGVLERFDAAWSRDQAEKIYVQHLMLERAAELWQWLEAGAAVYVCGDASRMAKDVDAALHQVVATQCGMSDDEAAGYVDQLKTDHRYQRDVY
ncbi:MAG: sulfite reductase flavoprotein subunit alpha [Planctomycetota bacterium]